MADLSNQITELEREKRDYDDRLTSLINSNQKLRDDLEDARANAEKEIQTWKTDAYSARSELKALEAALAGLKSQLAAATEREATLNKTVNDHIGKIRDRKCKHNSLTKFSELANPKTGGRADRRQVHGRRQGHRAGHRAEPPAPGGGAAAQPPDREFAPAQRAGGHDQGVRAHQEGARRPGEGDREAAAPNQGAGVQSEGAEELQRPLQDRGKPGTSQ